MDREFIKNLKADLSNSSWKSNLLELSRIGIDPQITFGVELESFNREVFYYDFYGYRMSNGWKIDEELSVSNGVEFVSPVLTDNIVDLNNLYHILDILKKYKFKETSKCGGHIHMGANYIETAKQLQFLMNLYAYMSDVIALISQKDGTEIREDAFKYAVPIRSKIDLLNRIKTNNLLIQKSMEQYASQCKTIFKCRFFDLNIYHIGNPKKNTVEFRIPNGEIDYVELVNNIRLFGKIMESIKKYTLRDIPTSNMSDKDKMIILLDMLFDHSEFRQIYEKRFYNNFELQKRKSKSKY